VLGELGHTSRGGGRLFGSELGGGEISCWVSWVTLDGTEADCLVASWVGERYCAG